MPLEPLQPAAVCFDVGWTSMTFNTGHRIRVHVSSGGTPLYEPNHHQDGGWQTVSPPEGGGIAGAPAVPCSSPHRLVRPLLWCGHPLTNGLL